MINEHDELRSLLARVRRRWFALTALSTIGRAAALAALPLAIAAVITWATALAGWPSVALVIATVALAAAAVGHTLFRMPRRPDDCRVARFVEEAANRAGLSPVVSDTLVSAVGVLDAPDRHPGGFASLVVGQAVAILKGTEPSAVIPAATVRRSALRAAGGVALLTSSLIVAGPALLRAGATIWVAAFPHSIGIQVLTGNVRVPAGKPLEIKATVSGRGARLLSVAPTLVVSANGQQRSVAMSAAGEGFHYSFESVDRSFEYRVLAGASSSSAFSVTALVPPRLESIDLAYEYPAFTGLAARQDPDSGDIYAPAGTRVRLRIHADKPIASGELRMTGGRPVPLAASSRQASAELVLTKDDAYRVRLADVDGLASDSDVEYFIRVMDDRPPAVHIVRPGSDQGITPLEEVAIEARADDDYGVARFELVYAVGGKPAKIVPFARVTGTDVARVGTHVLAAEELHVQPGDVITYYARARDVARGKQSSEARSDMFFLEVKPFSEEFVQAQSQAMMGGGPPSMQLDAMIAAQKEIINATWNLERRSDAGRSAADIKTVGDAQAELKTRAERMAGPARRGGRGFMPQQVLPQQPQTRGGNPNPVADAVAAMGRAVEQLHGTRTADALPHEMAALEGLLRAQAEVRRRQVMQQSASAVGAGGTSRTDRDLSALFDRELQRQQRTNYETPRQTTETPERQDGDLLDRIRDLARRQQELARRQRELAEAGLDPQEMRRQLDRLSREQEELQQQAATLQKQSQGGRGGTGRENSGNQNAAVQRAAEQMRNAANEMQRQNAAGAAASAEKAAEAMRQLEQQVGGSSPNGRQRAAGEMQLEAQQIADAQRRIAAEVSRLEKESAGAARAAADASRRLAAEKDALADRIDALERSTQEAERTTPGQEGARFRDAAQQLRQQQIGPRMRASAGELRKDGGGGKAGTDQQLARALDSVANALNGRNADAGKQLSEQLDRTRQIRDRLNGLEQQLRQADARAQGARQGSAAPRGEAEDVRRLREEYARELQRSRETLGRMQAEQRAGGGGATPEQHEYSRSAPGNEAFKQDFGRWESLRKDVDLALEKYEAGVAARLGRETSEDRLSAGGSERVPESYRRPVSRYFESIAKAKK